MDSAGTSAPAVYATQGQDVSGGLPDLTPARPRLSMAPPSAAASAPTLSNAPSVATEGLAGGGSTLRKHGSAAGSKDGRSSVPLSPGALSPRTDGGVLSEDGYEDDEDDEEEDGGGNKAVGLTASALADLSLASVVQKKVAGEDEVTKQMKRYAIFTYHGQVNRFAKRSLCCMRETSLLRRAAAWVIISPYFEMIVIAVILLNSAFLGLADYGVLDADGELSSVGSPMNAVVNGAEPYFAAFFVAEAVLKIVAMGFVTAPGSYLRNGWHVLDFVIVITAIISLFEGMPSTTVIRVVRVLRPLRAAVALPSMRGIVRALVRALPSLGNVVILVVFILGITSIMGLQLYMGTLQGRCRLTSSPVRFADGRLPGVCEHVDSAECFELLINATALALAGGASSARGSELYATALLATSASASGGPVLLAHLGTGQTLQDNPYATPAGVAAGSIAAGTSLYISSLLNSSLLVRCQPGPNEVAAMVAWSRVPGGYKDCWWPTDPLDKAACPIGAEPGMAVGAYACPPGRWCGSSWDASGQSRFAAATAMWSPVYNAERDWGITGYDHGLFAFGTSFQVATLEGWYAVYARVADSNNPFFAAFFFLIQVMMTGYFALSLTLAVLWESFKQSADAQRELDKQNAALLASFREAALRAEIARLEALETRVNEKLKGISDAAVKGDILGGLKLMGDEVVVGLRAHMLEVADGVVSTVSDVHRDIQGAGNALMTTVGGALGEVEGQAQGGGKDKAGGGKRARRKSASSVTSATTTSPSLTPYVGLVSTPGVETAPSSSTGQPQAPADAAAASSAGASSFVTAAAGDSADDSHAAAARRDSASTRPGGMVRSAPQVRAAPTVAEDGRATVVGVAVGSMSPGGTGWLGLGRVSSKRKALSRDPAAAPPEPIPFSLPPQGGEGKEAGGAALGRFKGAARAIAAVRGLFSSRTGEAASGGSGGSGGQDGVGGPILIAALVGPGSAAGSSGQSDATKGRRASFQTLHVQDVAQGAVKLNPDGSATSVVSGEGALAAPSTALAPSAVRRASRAGAGAGKGENAVEPASGGAVTSLDSTTTTAAAASAGSAGAVKPASVLRAASKLRLAAQQGSTRGIETGGGDAPALAATGDAVAWGSSTRGAALRDMMRSGLAQVQVAITGEEMAERGTTTQASSGVAFGGSLRQVAGGSSSAGYGTSARGQGAFLIAPPEGSQRESDILLRVELMKEAKRAEDKAKWQAAKAAAAAGAAGQPLGTLAEDGEGREERGVGGTHEQGEGAGGHRSRPRVPPSLAQLRSPHSSAAAAAGGRPPSAARDASAPHSSRRPSTDSTSRPPSHSRTPTAAGAAAEGTAAAPTATMGPSPAKAEGAAHSASKRRVKTALDAATGLRSAPSAYGSFYHQHGGGGGAHVGSSSRGVALPDDAQGTEGRLQDLESKLLALQQRVSGMGVVTGDARALTKRLKAADLSSFGVTAMQFDEMTGDVLPAVANRPSLAAAALGGPPSRVTSSTSVPSHAGSGGGHAAGSSSFVAGERGSFELAAGGHGQAAVRGGPTALAAAAPKTDSSFKLKGAVTKLSAAKSMGRSGLLAAARAAAQAADSAEAAAAAQQGQGQEATAGEHGIPVGDKGAAMDEQADGDAGGRTELVVHATAEQTQQVQAVQQHGQEGEGEGGGEEDASSHFSSMSRPLSKWEKARDRVRTWWESPVQRSPLGEACYTMVKHPLFDALGSIAVTVNVLLLSLDGWPPDANTTVAILRGNAVLTWYFSLELLFKLFACGLREYMSDYLNLFDFVVLSAAWIEAGATGGGGPLLLWAATIDPTEAASRSPVLRMLSLVRLRRLARKWHAFDVLVRTAGRTFLDAGSFTLLLGLFVYTFALVGQALFTHRLCFNPTTGTPVNPPEGPQQVGSIGDGAAFPARSALPMSCPRGSDVPRQNFDSLLHAVLAVFDVFTLESWPSVMYDAYKGYGFTAALFFIVVIIVGQYLVLDLFEAVLLSNFENQEHMSDVKAGAPPLPLPIKALSEGGKGRMRAAFDKVRSKLLSARGLSMFAGTGGVDEKGRPVGRAPGIVWKLGYGWAPTTASNRGTSKVAPSPSTSGSASGAGGAPIVIVPGKDSTHSDHHPQLAGPRSPVSPYAATLVDAPPLAEAVPPRSPSQQKQAGQQRVEAQAQGVEGGKDGQGGQRELSPEEKEEIRGQARQIMSAAAAAATVSLLSSSLDTAAAGGPGKPSALLSDSASTLQTENTGGGSGEVAYSKVRVHRVLQARYVTSDSVGSIYSYPQLSVLSGSGSGLDLGLAEVVGALTSLARSLPASLSTSKKMPPSTDSSAGGAHRPRSSSDPPGLALGRAGSVRAAGAPAPVRGGSSRRNLTRPGSADQTSRKSADSGRLTSLQQPSTYLPPPAPAPGPGTALSPIEEGPSSSLGSRSVGGGGRAGFPAAGSATRRSITEGVPPDRSPVRRKSERRSSWEAVVLRTQLEGEAGAAPAAAPPAAPHVVGPASTTTTATAAAIPQEVPPLTTAPAPTLFTGVDVPTEGAAHGTEGRRASLPASRRASIQAAEQAWKAARNAVAEGTLTPSKKTPGKGFSSARNLHADAHGSHKRKEAKQVPLQGNALFVLSPSNPVRRAVAYIVRHKWFDRFIMGYIIASCVVLAIDDPMAKPGGVFETGIRAFDRVTAGVFTAEAVLKLITYGAYFNGQKSYFRSSWNILDAFVTGISLSSVLMLDSRVRSLRSLRALRSLRPLRMLKSLPGLRLIVNSMLLSTFQVLNVLAIFSVFLWVYALLAVGFFKGSLYACQGPVWTVMEAHPVWGAEGTALVTYPPQSAAGLTPVQASLFRLMNASFPVPPAPSLPVTSRAMCLALFEASATRTTAGMVEAFDSLRALDVYGAKAYDGVIGVGLLDSGSPWRAVLPGKGFDDLPTALLTLFTMTTTEGWPLVMRATMDSRGPDTQPVRDSFPAWAAFWTSFMLLGAFFVARLFIAVVLENYNDVKGKLGGSAFLTADQREWVKTQKIMARLRLSATQKSVEPSWPAYRRVAWYCSMHPYAERAVFVLILANTVLLCVPHMDASTELQMGVQYANYAFNGLFTAELLLRLVAMSFRQFASDRWNVFDTAVVVASNVGIILEQASGNSAGGLGSQVALAARAMRLGRILRLVGRSGGLSRMFDTFLAVLPSLVNTGAVITLILYMYAVVGVELFHDSAWGTPFPGAAYGAGLSRVSNFQSFGLAFMTLFRSFTGEGWDGIMVDLSSNGVGSTTNGCIDVGLLDYEQKAGYCGYTAYTDYSSGKPCVPIPGCGDSILAYPYYISYALFMSLLFINLLIAVVLEGFSEVEQAVTARLGDVHFTALAKAWSKLDPFASGYIDCNDLPFLLQGLPEPMGFGPRHILTPYQLKRRAARLHLPVYGATKVHFYDVVQALARRVYADDARKAQQEGFAVPRTEDTRMLRRMLLQRTATKGGAMTNVISGLVLAGESFKVSGYDAGQVFAARLIQNAWRRVQVRRKKLVRAENGARHLTPDQPRKSRSKRGQHQSRSKRRTDESGSAEEQGGPEEPRATTAGVAPSTTSEPPSHGAHAE